MPVVRESVSTRSDEQSLDALPALASPGSREFDPAPSWLRTLEAGFAGTEHAAVIVFPDGRRCRCGQGSIVGQLHLRNSKAVRALASMDEGNIAQAYVDEDLDVTGSLLHLLQLRSVMSDRHYLSFAWRFLQPLIFGQSRTNARVISNHYDLDAEFYLSFLDETRCYTQGIFLNDEEPLHVAIRRKFDYCIESCRLGPGSRVLEVGPGWGAFAEYAAARGIHITAITNSVKSKEFMESLGPRVGKDCRVHVGDFLEFRLQEKFDAIVIMGIMEHLPQYDAVVKQFSRLLKPGGFVYLDASATRAKYDVGSFIYREIYRGNHSFFVLHDFLRAVSHSSLQVRAVWDDRHSYFLTFKHWAQKFESQRRNIVARFGERNYRRFHLYLWGSVDSFLKDVLQCYRLVLEQPKA